MKTCATTTRRGVQCFPPAHWLAPVLWLCSAVASAQQQCLPRLVLQAATPDLERAGDLARAQTVTLPIQVRLQADRDPCPIRLGLGARVVSSAPVEARVRTRPNGTLLSADLQASPREQLSLLLRSGQWLEQTVWLELSARSELASRSNRIEVQLLTSILAEDTLGSTVLLEREQALALELPAVLDVELDTGQGWSALGGTRAELALGELSDGAHAQARIRLSGNVAAQIQLESLGAGYLQHEGLARYRIPYRLSLDGVPIADSSSYPALDPLDQSRELRLDIDIDPPRRMAAGAYSDVLQITVIPE